MGCGSWCVYFENKVIDICKSCSEYEGGVSPRFELGKVDPFKLAIGLAEKREKERRGKIPRLSDCPICHEHSLFYNLVDDKFECLNQKCAVKQKHILPGTPEYKSILLRVLTENETENEDV